MRKAEIKRSTSETDITVKLVLGSPDKPVVRSGVPFFDHMLNAMARHGHVFLDLECRGDNELDDHHSVEDIGICMGKAFRKAMGDKAGIVRFGQATVPMDDALCLAAVDISGRCYFRYTGPDLKGYIGNYHEELTLEFLRSFADNAGINLHVMLYYGENRHHIHEAIFKALGIALYRAYSIDPGYADQVPSTKDVLA
ncbi:MAG: imidazoleglycerol-phosphate dehydratase HisB [Spirochaetes bacterium]|nr:MAG: imidazoleglycerol-phosphate dehydratase HisB [Spirochaetota bacterium]